jgi:hypothetical protein
VSAERRRAAALERAHLQRDLAALGPFTRATLSIGMTHTSFTDPSGLDATDLSNATDLFTLLKYINDNRYFIFDMALASSSVPVKIDRQR